MKTNFKISNRILSLVLSLVMVLGMLPMTGITASAATTKRTTKLSLSVTSSDSQNEAEGWSWVKGEDAWTLTLNNANIEVADDVAVYINTSTTTEPRNINIVLNGDNRIVSTKSSTQGDISSLGIKIEDFKAGMPSVTFSGDGTLLVKGQSSGIYSSNNIIFDNANVTVEGGYYGGINLVGSDGNSLTIKNNSVVNVNHSTSDGNAYGNAIYASYGDITVENSTLNVSVASNGGTLNLVKAANAISVSNSTLVLNVNGTGTTWRWGVGAPKISISDSTVNATNIYNLASMVIGSASNNAVTMKNVSGAFLHTVSVASSSAAMENCNIYYCSRTGDVTAYGNATLPDSVSEITGKLSFKNSTDSLKIPSGKSLTFSGTPKAGVGTIINNGSLIIYSPNTFSGSSCTLSGTGDFLLMTEATPDCIVVPDDLVYTGSVLLTEDTDRVYLQEPQGTVTILETAFKQQLLDKANWVLSFDRTVLNAGEYTATFTNNGKTVYKTFSVSKAPVSVSTPIAQNSITYGVKLSEVGLPSDWVWADGNTVPTVKNNGYVAYYTPADTDNYDWATVDGWNATEKRVERTVSVIVNKSDINLDKAPEAKTDLVYNGSEQELISAGSATNGTMQYALGTAEAVTGEWKTELPKSIQAGTYYVWYKAVGNDNYNDVAPACIVATIEKADYDMSNAKWNYTEAFNYDGKSHTVWFDENSLPDGVFVSNYTGNTASAVGKYTANVSLSYDYDNYNHPNFNTLLEWEIKNDWIPTEYIASTPNEGGWLNGDFAITAADGYKVSLTNTADGTWEDALRYTEETSDSSVTFYLRNETDGTISLAKTVTYKLDRTAAIGTVTFTDAKTAWDKIPEIITFGIYVNTDQEITVTSNDNLSDVAKVEYYETKDILDLAGAQALDNSKWTEMTNGSVTVSAEDAKQFIYYIRITDNAGNVTYLSTNGAEYDTTAPVISGIENGGTYYTTQVLTVEDKNLVSVELDGETVILDNGTLTLAGNVDATYTIKVADKAGNVTEYTVTMKTIAELTESLDDITVDDVTSDDKEIIEQVIEDIDEQLANDDLTEDEKAALEETKDKAQDLLDKIDETAEAADTENTEKVKDITADNVTPEDKSDLEKAKEDLERTLDDYSDNLTEDEKKAIEDEINRIDKAIAIIEKVEAVEDKIGSLSENIQKNDEAAINAADDAYNALSDYEKSLVDEDAKKALDEAKAALAELNKPADTTSPNTGDNSNLWLWFAVAFISGGAVITLIVVDRKRRMEK